MLRELQRDLAAAFCESGVEGPAARRALATLAPMGGVAPTRSLEIYQRSLRSAVGQALGEIFPVCAELVGPDCFRTIARHHARQHVSRHPDLARIGDSLPALIPRLDFLDAVPYLADMARLELAVHRAAGAGEPPAVADPEGVAAALGERPDAWRLVLSPASTLVESRHPIRAIWSAHQDPTRGEACFQIEPIRAPERMIVWRSREGVRVDVVEDRLWSILEAITRCAPVAELLESDDQGHAGDQPHVETALEAISLLFERRWVVGVEPLGDPGDRSGLIGRCTEASTVIEGKRRTRK